MASPHSQAIASSWAGFSGKGEAGCQGVNPGGFARAVLSPAAAALGPGRGTQLTQLGSVVKGAALWLCLFPWGSSRCSSSLALSSCSSERQSKDNKTPLKADTEESCTRSSSGAAGGGVISTHSGPCLSAGETVRVEAVLGGTSICPGFFSRVEWASPVLPPASSARPRCTAAQPCKRTCTAPPSAPCPSAACVPSGSFWGCRYHSPNLLGSQKVRVRERELGLVCSNHLQIQT